MTEVRVPDVPGVIVGWRTWSTLPRRVDYLSSFLGGMSPPEGHTPERLHSVATVSGAAVWPARLPMDARCLSQKDHGDHYAPGEDCTCGVYARSDMQGIVTEAKRQKVSLDDLDRAVYVVGQVDLWGKVREGERGWRAEHARVHSLVRLWGDERDAAMAALADAYRVPVVQSDGPIAEWVEGMREARRREREAQKRYAQRRHDCPGCTCEWRSFHPGGYVSVSPYLTGITPEPTKWDWFKRALGGGA